MKSIALDKSILEQNPTLLSNNFRFAVDRLIPYNHIHFDGETGDAFGGDEDVISLAVTQIYGKLKSGRIVGITYLTGDTGQAVPDYRRVLSKVLPGEEWEWAGAMGLTQTFDIPREWPGAGFVERRCANETAVTA
jgi:hypothetical protein